MRLALRITSIAVAAVAGAAGLTRLAAPEPQDRALTEGPAPRAEASRVGVTPGDAASFAYTYAPGRALRYRLSYRGESRLTVPGKPEVQSGVGLEADLVLASRGVAEDGHAYLDLALTEVREAKLLLPDGFGAGEADALARALREVHTVLELAPSGALLDVHADPASPGMARLLVQLLASELQVVIAPGPVWEVEQAGSVGTGLVRYEAMGAGGRLLRRERTRYERLYMLDQAAHPGAPPETEASLVAVLDPRGWVSSLRGTEATEVIGAQGEPLAEVSFEVDYQLLSVDEVPTGGAAGDLAGLEAMGPVLALPESSGLELEARAKRLSAAQLLHDLRTLPDSGRFPDHNRWLASALARLELEPALAAELVAACRNGRCSLRAQALVGDLLMNAGHAEAQAAFRTLLGEVSAASPELLPRVVQSASLLGAPDAATTEAVRELHRRAPAGEVRDASALTLGALAHAAGRHGDGASAQRLTAELGQELSRSRIPSEQRALLLALGNSRTEGALAVVGPWLGSEEAEVRAAAARALRWQADPAARARLWELSADPDDHVQGQVLRAILTRRASPEELATLADLVTGGVLRAGTLGDLVAHLERKADLEGAEALALLRAIEATALKPTLRGRVESLLVRAGGT